MNYFQIVWQSFLIALSQSISFKVKNYLVTIVTPIGTVPNHLTFAQAIKAIQLVLANGVGTIQVGNVSLSVVAI